MIPSRSNLGLTAAWCVFWLNGLALAQPDVHDRPLNAENAWPRGSYGVDHSTLDAEGMRHGMWVRVYGGGELYYRGEFDHGRPSGEWWYFREDGTAITHLQHGDDPLESTAQMFTRDGRVAATGGYLHQDIRVRGDVQTSRPTPPVRHGSWTLFDGAGNVTTRLNYDRGVKAGLEERFLPSGQVFERATYVDGELDGTWTAWHDNGLPRQVVTYRKGNLDGPFKAFYGGGQRLSEGAYLDGVEEGSWKFYLEDGQLQHIHRYRDGQLLETIRVNGTFTEWHGEERPASEYTYKDKQLDGPFREWHDQGGFVLEDFKDPQLGETLQRRVMRGVQISKEGEYVQGELDGPVYHYDPAGRLLKTEHYNMGTLQRTDAGW